MYSKSNSTFVEINKSLNKIYKYLISSKNEELGKDLFKKLIKKYIFQNTLIFSIINDLEEKIAKCSIKEKYKYTNLLSIFFENNEYDIPLGTYLPYLNPILSIIQSTVIEKNIDFLPKIPEIFMKIIQNLIPDDILASNKKLSEEEKKIYEILQNFCVFNLKFDKKINQVIGSLCLTKLVENCPYVLKNEYIKTILDNILSLLSSENFDAKAELLNCLISLILGAENLFIPYAQLVFNKIIDFLANRDWIQRKLSLNIIYTLSLYCKTELISLKENILNILSSLKKDKVKEIRDISFLIAQMYEKDLINNSKKAKMNKKRNNHLSTGNIINKIKKINYIKYNNISSFSPNRTINNIKNKIQNMKQKKLFKEINTTPKKVNSKPKKRKSSFNNSLSDYGIKNKKYINRTRNLSFVNEKMVIKPDPNKSIFNTRKNLAFFKQNNNSDKKNKNLIIISNKEENDIKKKYNTFEGFYKNKNRENNKDENIEDISFEKNNFEDNNEILNKDEDISKDDINRLILLDAQIKKDKIKKIDYNLISSTNNKTNSLTQQADKSEDKEKVKGLNNNNLIKVLLFEVRELSNKQISLLDLMEEIQTNTQNQIEYLNSKIINLDDTIKELTEELYILQNEQ